MKPSTKRILIIILSVALLVGALVVYGNFIRPEMESVAKARSLAASKENLLNNQTAAVVQVQNVISQFQTAEGFSEKIALAIPREPATTDALNQVYAISLSSKADLLDFSVEMQPFRTPSGESVIRQLGTVSLNISARGAYQDIKSFLQSLETNARIANVGEMRITPVAGMSGTYTISATVEMYFQN